MSISSRKKAVPCLILIVLGLLVSSYLYVRTLLLLTNHSPDVIDICQAVFGTGCDETLLSSTSWQLGIPLAGWGIVNYVSLAFLLAMAWLMGEAFESEATLAALLLSVGAAFASILLAISMFAGWAPLCAFCLVVHTINLLLVPALKRLDGRSIAELLGALRSGFRIVFARNTALPVEARWKLVGLFATALVALLAHQWVYIESTMRKGGGEEPESIAEILAAYQAQPVQEIPVTSANPRMGNDDAPVRIVVFSSFQCPGCRELAAVLAEQMEERRGKLQVVFINYPLGTDCNPELKVNQHPEGCAAACAAVAAHRQGKFWPFHNALFETGVNSVNDHFLAFARQVGLDLPRFEADVTSPSTMEQVRADVELGNRLQVKATPAVFINGRRLRPLSLTTLNAVIQHELVSGSDK